MGKALVCPYSVFILKQPIPNKVQSRGRSAFVLPTQLPRVQFLMLLRAVDSGLTISVEPTNSLRLCYKNIEELLKKCCRKDLNSLPSRYHLIDSSASAMKPLAQFLLYASGSLQTTKRGETKSTATRHDMFVEKFASIPDIAKLGPLFKSSSPAELTGNLWLYSTKPSSRLFFPPLFPLITLISMLASQIALQGSLCDSPLLPPP